jgi:hypothetical protein
MEKEKAIYEPGELDRVRKKLGSLDPTEAKRLANVLGGEVGVEKAKAPQSPVRSAKNKHERVDLVVGSRGNAGRSPPKRRVELASDEDEELSKQKQFPPRGAGGPGDDPKIPVKPSCLERIKMDNYAARAEFDIKSLGQVLLSIISLFTHRPDYVNPHFVTKRMNEYYKQLEALVTSTRTLLPRNNQKRNDRIQKSSSFVFSVLDTIRYWNIERIAAELARIQARPRSVKAFDFAEILRHIYRPLFILEPLDTEIHIKGAYKRLYRALYLENPTDINLRDRYQELTRTAITAFEAIRKDVQYLLYPLLMKLLSDRWLPYQRFFIDRRNRFMAFINAAEEDQIQPAAVTVFPDEREEGEISDESPLDLEAVEEEEDEDDPQAEEKRAKRNAAEAEQKALDRGLLTLEALFPKAGWDRLDTYPDLYPYFANIFDLRRGYDLIAPTDPIIQIAVLIRIVEELFFGLRYVSFGAITGADGNPDGVSDILGKIINNWNMYIELSFVKEYLPRLGEYCRILESTTESRTSNYAKRILNELHWTKRLYFLPYYKFESLFPPPFQKKDITPLYPEIRQLRKYLTAVAAGIEQGNKRGGAEAKAPCDGIDNPWAPYVFQVPNPLSIRLDALLANKKKNNASLLFFTLAVTTVLDYLVNNENSWAYRDDRPGPLFRSVNEEGVMPQFGVESFIDADALFKEALKQREPKQE